MLRDGVRFDKLIYLERFVLVMWHPIEAINDSAMSMWTAMCGAGRWPARLSFSHPSEPIPVSNEPEAAGDKGGHGC